MPRTQYKRREKSLYVILSRALSGCSRNRKPLSPDPERHAPQTRYHNVVALGNKSQPLPTSLASWPKTTPSPSTLDRRFPLSLSLFLSLFLPLFLSYIHDSVCAWSSIVPFFVVFGAFTQIKVVEGVPQRKIHPSSSFPEYSEVDSKRGKGIKKERKNRRKRTRGGKIQHGKAVPQGFRAKRSK